MYKTLIVQQGFADETRSTGNLVRRVESVAFPYVLDPAYHVGMSSRGSSRWADGLAESREEN